MGEEAVKGQQKWEKDSCARASGTSSCPLQPGYCVGATCSCILAERGVHVEAQPGKMPPQAPPLCV